MPEYRRAFVPGGTFFLTLVTNHRAPIFGDPQRIARLRDALATVRRERPFEVAAAVVLSDHLHFIWELPVADSDFSRRVGRLKSLFTKSLPSSSVAMAQRSRSQSDHRESGIWQRRFWEHTIRDEEDLERHIDYVHYNPVKHGLVECPHAWPHSSFAKWVERGVYERAWCCTCEGRTRKTPDFTDIAHTVGE